MNPLTFRRLRIERLLGVTDGIELNGLSAGVNIVYGPNASGKTTTARALESLLWPQAAAPGNAVVSARAGLGDDEWSIRVDSGHVDVRRNGDTATLPVTPADGRDRYRLWLPDLLSADDADFARRILIESSGGFDLERAAAALEARPPQHRQRREQVELRHARERVASASRAEAELLAEVETLAAKQAQLERRGELVARHSHVTLALERLEASDRASEANARLAAWPPILERLRGDEANRIEQLRERLSETRGKRNAAAKTVAAAEKALAEAAVPEAVLAGDLLDRLKADVEELTETERSVAELERAHRAAIARAEAEERAFPSGSIDPTLLEAIDLASIGELDAAVEEVEDLRAQRRILEAELQALPTEPPPPDLDRIQNGVFLLSQWLASTPRGREQARDRAITFAGLGLAFAAGVAVASAGLLWLGIGIIVASAALAVMAVRTPEPGDPRADREREFVALGLSDRPDRWDVDAVESCRARLEQRVREAREHERALQRRRELSGQLEDLERRQPGFDQNLRELARVSGFSLPAGAVRLLWLVRRLSDWRGARGERNEAEVALVEAFGRRQRLLAAANERLVDVGLPPTDDPRSLAGTVAHLDRSVQTHERLTDELRHAVDQLDRESEDLARLEAEIQSLFDRLELEPAQEHRLKDWCAAVPDHRTASVDARVADGHLNRLDTKIAGIEGFDSDLLTFDVETLKVEKGRLETELATLHTLAEEVGSLRERIDVAKRSHALEDALTTQQEALEALRSLRERELRAAVAAVLIEYVRRETRREHLPRVFHRANDIFTLVTNHAYELRVDGGGTGAFQAVDTRTNRIHTLDELSSGTRIQLLLSVRIAFVEALESGVALPLLMDETLANSDETRAAAVMDAVVKIAAAGRQVFYFTAQPEEVARWRRTLVRTSEVEWSVQDLARARGLGGVLDLATVEDPPRFPPPDIPIGVPHSEMPGVLSIPLVDPHAPSGALHLWYLVEDADVLRYLLGTLRISTWGELRSVLDADGRGGLDADVAGRVRALAQIADRALADMKVGRGRPVDRAVLLASRAVSSRFIDELVALTVDSKGDARRILEALDARAIPGFQIRKVSDLREFLRDEGYLDDRKPWPMTDIRLRSLTVAASELAGGTLSVRQIDGLLDRLARGSGIAADRNAPVPDQALLPLPEPG